MVKVSLELCLNLMSYSIEFGQLTKTEELSEEAQSALELLVQAHEAEHIDFVTLAELYHEFGNMTSGRLQVVSRVTRTILHQINQQIKITSNETV